MPLRKRPSAANNDGDGGARSLSLNSQEEAEIIPEQFYSFDILSINTQSQLPSGHSQLLPNSNANRTGSRHSADARDVIMVQHSCLLIPVAVVAWWYWAKRKARAAMAVMLHHSSHHQETKDSQRNDVPDDFSTWDEVVENESQDRSVRFVRWINANDSGRQRASVKQASRRTLRLLKNNLADDFVDEDSIASAKREEGGWQCLDEAHGIELCAAASEDYIEMGELQGKA